MIQTQVINLVIGVVPRPARITHATSDRVGSCGAKLLNGFNRTPVAGRPTASLPVRTHFITTPALCKRASFFRERVRHGGWFAPEELDMQAIDYQPNYPAKFLTSLLRFGSGWFANNALQRTGVDGFVARWSFGGAGR
jgi:hypothetical protein